MSLVLNDLPVKQPDTVLNLKIALRPKIKRLLRAVFDSYDAVQKGTDLDILLSYDYMAVCLKDCSEVIDHYMF